MRLDVITPRITHIITNTTTNIDLEQVRVKQPDTGVASVQWLKDIMKTGVQIAEIIVQPPTYVSCNA